MCEHETSGAQLTKARPGWIEGSTSRMPFSSTAHSATSQNEYSPVQLLQLLRADQRLFVAATQAGGPSSMDRGMRVGAWLIASSVLATILLNCLGRSPHRKDLVSIPALLRPAAAPE